MATGNSENISPETIAWDTEQRNDLLPKEAVLRDTTIYLGAPLLEWMEKEWGGVLTFVKTSTNVDTGEVLVAKAKEKEPGAVPVRRVGTHNTALFSFWRPLRKLNIKVPADRQFHLRPRKLTVGENLTVFVFAMNERQSAPRHISEEAEAQAAASVEGETKAEG